MVPCDCGDNGSDGGGEGGWLQSAVSGSAQLPKQYTISILTNIIIDNISPQREKRGVS